MTANGLRYRGPVPPPVPRGANKTTNLSVVEIRNDGSMRLESSASAERLTHRQGRYRLHDSSSGVILLERIDSSDDSDDRLVTYGEVTSAVTILEVVQSVTQSGWSGSLTVVSKRGRRRLRIDRGTLTSAQSNAASERLGDIMVARGMITRQEALHCLRAAGPTGRFGETVVLEGLIDPEELFAMLQAQARCIFSNALLTAGGHYLCTVPTKKGEPPAMSVHIPIQGLLMESMQRIDELAVFREHIPNGDVCPRRTAAATDLAIEDDFRAVANLTNGMNSIMDIARELGLDEFSVTKAIMHLLQVGYLETSPLRATVLKAPRTS